MRAFKRWFLLFLLMKVGGVVAWYYGVPLMIWEADITKLSAVIYGLLSIGTILMGYSAWKVGKNPEMTHNMSNRLYVGWFLAEAMMVLGLAGTVIGFIVLFQGNFEGVSFDDPETVEAVIVSIASGMGVALYTTIVGILSSLLLKMQLVNVEVAINEQAEV